MSYLLEWTDEQLEAAGIDKRRLVRMVRQFRRISNEMAEMGLHVYGASGSGCLIHESRPTHNDGRNCEADKDSVVAHIGQGFDGGDW